VEQKGTWKQWQFLVLDKLERLPVIEKELQEIKLELARKDGRSAAFGAMAGMLATIAPDLFKLAMKALKG
jgi:hypothetical protein